jgi:hypothetical protein
MRSRRSLQIVTFLRRCWGHDRRSDHHLADRVVQRLAARVIVRQANNYLNGQLTIRRLGNLFYGVELTTSPCA